MATAAAANLASGTAAAMGALEVVLADMAVDLEAIDTKAAPGNEDWRRYLAGDRAVFARKLATAIDDDTVDRITTLYRDDERFHEAANAYLCGVRSAPDARPGRRWRRPSDFDDPVGGYRQDLSRHRLCARAAIADGATARKSEAPTRYDGASVFRPAARPNKSGVG